MSAKSEFRQLVREQGVPAAYRGLMRVLDDPKASATALASAARTMLEAGGVLKVPEDEGAKEPHEMTAAELTAKISELRRAASDRATLVIDAEANEADHVEAPSGVFG